MASCVGVTSEGYLYQDETTAIEECALLLLERSEFDQLFTVFDFASFDSMAVFGTAFSLVVFSYFMGYPIGLAVSLIRKV